MSKLCGATLLRAEVAESGVVRVDFGIWRCIRERGHAKQGRDVHYGYQGRGLGVPMSPSGLHGRAWTDQEPDSFDEVARAVIGLDAQSVGPEYSDDVRCPGCGHRAHSTDWCDADRTGFVTSCPCGPSGADPHAPPSACVWRENGSFGRAHSLPFVAHVNSPAHHSDEVCTAEPSARGAYCHAEPSNVSA